ncbi:gamma-glutamyltransferase [Arenibaculum pallidiluteum]|uniref:gamma-glutamyltransferase n=1 Tax=Arenibaculum pallidiluteum TaxID=2812559 RepID=UPI001A96B8FF|nr:gamma-glutamyltransferase [Arenibaculum pallidiluteum]
MFSRESADPRYLATSVAADEPRAVLVGRETLAAGGSAADAAAAMGLAMAATLPARVGVGGGGVCVVHDPARKTVRTLDFLPRAAGPGATAAVPGLLRGLDALQAGHGTLRWAQVAAPAEVLARSNRAVSRAAALDFGDFEPVLTADAEARRVFVQPLGHPPDESEPLAQADLAALLSQVRQSGSASFYNGPLGARVAEAAGIPLQAMRGYQATWRGTRDVRSGNETLVFPDLPEGQPAAAAWQAAMAAPGAGALAGLQALGALPAATPPTASLVVFDGQGMSVACGFSMGGPFGTGRMVPGTGLMLAAPAAGAGIAGPLVVANRNIERGRLLAVGTIGLPDEGPAAPYAALLATATAALDRDASAREAVAVARIAPAAGGGALVERGVPQPVAASLGPAARQVPTIGRANIVDCKVREDGGRSCRAATDPRAFGLALTAD